ncbi:MAG TPA: translation initiation factor 2 [Thiolapillus brandeum]|uniref:Translation initiation factor 2 n=1 Tax=Thiolapillus brandeum TaxID=1076588 RepID=A0A7C5IZU7_9GAMM|nr:translation initiation factor 2 [Thiolapillus brandeum]
MAEERQKTSPRVDPKLLRAARSFEAILFSQIEIQEKLGNDLKNAIRFGMVILGIIAISILVLLLTLSSQINRISAVVADMNRNVQTVTSQMDRVSNSMDSMVRRVALLEAMDTQTASMKREMMRIDEDIAAMRGTIGTMGTHVTEVRQSVENMATTISRMDDEVQMMAADMQYMAKPARTIKKMFPVP